MALARYHLEGSLLSAGTLSLGNFERPTSEWEARKRRLPWHPASKARADRQQSHLWTSASSSAAEWQVARTSADEVKQHSRSDDIPETLSPSRTAWEDFWAREETEGGFCLMNEGPTSCSFRLGTLTEADAPAMEELLNAVQFDPPVWRDVFQMDRRDVLGIWDHSGQGSELLAGMVSAVYYPKSRHESMSNLDDSNPFGWIGNVVVHSEYRSRGLARVLLSEAVHHLQTNRRCKALLLDASMMGKHVYDKLGFQDLYSVHCMKILPQDLERAIRSFESKAESTAGLKAGVSSQNKVVDTGSSRSLQAGNAGLLSSILKDITETEFGRELTTSRVAESAAAVQPIIEEDTWQAVMACDGQVFGADRALLLRQWQRRTPAGAVWLPNRTSEETGNASSSLGGPVGSYAFAHTRRHCHYVGPIVAGNGAFAGGLLLSQLRQIALLNESDEPRPCVIYIVEPPDGPETNESNNYSNYLVWCRWLESLGFQRETSTIRQVLGEVPDTASLSHYFAVASLDLG